MKKTKIIKNGTSILFYMALAFCLMISITMIRAKVSGKQPEILGYKFFVVLTGSMEPELPVGDLIIVKSIDPMKIKTDDVITFQSTQSNNMITHRVKGISNDNNIEFITKGDANKVEDPHPVDSDNVIGKVSGHLPKVGGILKFVQTKVKVVLIVILAIATMLAFINGIKKAKVSKRNKSE